LHDIVQRLRELAPDATPAAAAQLRPAAKQLLRGPGHAVEHLLQQAAPDATWLRAAVLEYLATSEHCCDRVQVDAMLDAGVAELLAASMDAEPGGEAHLARQACRLLAAMAYQLASAAPCDEEESLVALRMFQDATVAALVAYMRRHVADSTEFTMALTAAMKGLRDSEVAGRFNRHGLVAALEAALAHSRAHSDGAAEVRVLRFTWQFLGALTVRAVVPLRTLTQALVYALPRTAASAWMPSDYARLMVLTRTMRWTRCLAPKTLRTLRSLCVSVLTHTVTADNVLGGFCCLYLFSILCMLKTPECALEGAGMPGHGLVAEVLDETCSVKQCIFWSQTLECYRAWLRLPVPAAPACEEQDGIVVQFLRQQCLGDILSKYVEPGVCTPGACERLLHCCMGFVSEAAPTHTVLLLHKLHMAMVCVQRGLSPPCVVLAALGVVRACAGLAAEAQHHEVRTPLLLEIVVNIDPEHLRQALIGRAALDCLDCLVRGGGKVHVLQGPDAASLHTCVERDLYVLLDPEQASMILRFFAQNLLQLAACRTDAVFAALVCHAIRAPEDIALLVTHGLNVACIIEFFSVKVTEGCTFFGVWLLAGVLGACVEKHVPVPPELDSLLCCIGPRGFARALDKLEAAAVAGRTITPLAFSLYFWHLLVSAVDEVFDEQARRALDATAVRCGTGASKRFADLLVGALESREEQREEQRARARKNADALLQELEHEEHTGGNAGKGRRSRRQRRAAKGVVASGDLPSAGGAVGARAADATDVEAIVDGRPCTPSPVGVLHNSRRVLVSQTLNAGESPSDAGSQWRSWPDLRILPDSPLVWSGFPDLRDPLQQPAAEGMLCVQPYTLCSLQGLDYSQSTIETYRNSTQATFHNLPDIRHFSTEAKEYVYSMPATIPQYSMPARIPQPLNMHAFSAMAMQCLLDELSRANSRASLASSGFGDSRSSSRDVVAFRGGDRLQSPCAGAGVHSTSPVNPTPHLASQQRLRIVEACAAETEDKGVRAQASDDSARAEGHAGTNLAECAVCLEEVEKEKLVVLVPCGHVCMCKKCASPMASCPICRAKVQQVVTPFYSWDVGMHP
tara:strand:- start:1633 stop:4881 length:3249 start_codon:yes stop_codon:yes gene_type:complete